MDMIHVARSGFASCGNRNNIIDWKQAKVVGNEALSLSQGQALEAHGATEEFVVLDAPETVGWIEHFQFIQAEIGGQTHRVHLGFWNAIGPHLEDLGQGIADKVGDTESLVVAGYGQAGAVANILALHMHLAHNKSVKLITYGAPRVGDYAFSAALDRHLTQVHRIVRAGDPYSVVPTTSCKDYFRCLGGEMPFVYYVHAGLQTTLAGPSKRPSYCAHPTFHHEGVDGGLGHIHKLRHSTHAKKCFGRHEVDGYVHDVAKQVSKGSDWICTKPTFVPLPPTPPPPEPVVKKLYIDKDLPSLKNWGVRRGFDEAKEVRGFTTTHELF
jgi:hypothetical protein